MFENFMNIFKKTKKNKTLTTSSKDAAKERLHLVLMQDRANVSADFLDLMRREIIEVIKKYIDIDEKSMDVRLTTETNEDGTQGAPALYANIPIINIKDETRKLSKTNQDHKIEIKLTEKKHEEKVEEKTEDKKEEKENKKEPPKNQDDNKGKKDTEEQKNQETKENENNKKEESEGKETNNDEQNVTVEVQKSTDNSTQNKEEKENNNEE